MITASIAASIAVSDSDDWARLSLNRKIRMARSLIVDDAAWALTVSAMPDHRWNSLDASLRSVLARGGSPRRWSIALTNPNAHPEQVARRLTELAWLSPEHAATFYCWSSDDVWRAIPPDSRDRIIQTACAPKTVEFIAGSCPPDRWKALDDSWKRRLIRNSTTSPRAAHAMLLRLSMDAVVPPEAMRTALIDCVASSDHESAALCDAHSTLWHALREQDRDAIACSAARAPDSAARALRALIARRRHVSPAVWRALGRSVSRDHGSVLSLLRSLEPGDIDAAPRPVWRRLCLEAMRTSEGRAVISLECADDLWEFLNDGLRRRLVQSATGDDAATILVSMTESRWDKLDEAHRQTLIDRTCESPAAAASVIVRASFQRWRALGDSTRRRLLLQAFQHPDSLETVIRRASIARWIETWTTLDPSVRRFILDALPRCISPAIARRFFVVLMYDPRITPCPDILRRLADIAEEPSR
jgi:hypothetical protein